MEHTKQSQISFEGIYFHHTVDKSKIETFYELVTDEFHGHSQASAFASTFTQYGDKYKICPNLMYTLFKLPFKPKFDETSKDNFQLIFTFPDNSQLLLDGGNYVWNFAYTSDPFDDEEDYYQPV